MSVITRPCDPYELRKCLDSLGFLDSLTIEDSEKLIQEIAMCSQSLSLANGEKVYSYGDSSEALYFVREHSCAIVIARSRNQRNDMEFTSRILWPSDIFGIEELVASNMDDASIARRSATMLVSGDQVNLIKISYVGLIEQIGKYPAIANSLAAAALDSIFDLEMSYGDTVLKVSLEVRLAEFLLRLTRLMGSPEGRGFRIDMPFDQSTLAEQLNVGRTQVSRQMADWSKRGIIKESGKKNLYIPDQIRLRKLTFHKSPSPRDHRSLIADIQTVFACGHWFQSRNLAFDGLNVFPNCSQLHYLIILSTARMNAPEEAVQLLRQFGYENGDFRVMYRRVSNGILNPINDQMADDDEALDCPDNWNLLKDSPEFLITVDNLMHDFLGLLPRLQKDQAFWFEPGKERNLSLSNAAQGYLQAYQYSKAPYHLINAITVSQMAGQSHVAVSMIKKMRYLTPGSSYWDHATNGELALAKGNQELADGFFSEAGAISNVSVAARATTRLQLTRLQEQSGLSLESCLDSLKQPNIGVYTGHRYLDTNLSDAEDVFDTKKEELKGVLENESIGFAYGSLACGADLLLAECVIESGAELHVVLPVPVDQFIKLSVTDRAVPNKDYWLKKFDHCIEHAASVRILHDGRFKKGAYDELIHQANHHMIGLAQMHATEIVSTCTLLAMISESPSCETPGAINTLQMWNDHSMGQSITISCPWSHPRPQSTSKSVRMFNQDFRFSLHIWISGNREDKSKGVAGSIEKAVSLIEALLTNAGGEGIMCRSDSGPSHGTIAVFNDISSWPSLIEQVIQVGQDQECDVRILSDYRMIRLKDGLLSASSGRQLLGWRDIPELPSNMICASEYLAAHVKSTMAEKFKVTKMSVGVDSNRASRTFYRIRPTV